MPNVSTSDVAGNWDRLHRWYAEHLPVVMETWNPPASEEQIADFERRIGRPLPEEVKASYRIHDGQRQRPGALYGLALHSLDEILEHWEQARTFGMDEVFEKGVHSSQPEGAVQLVTLHPGWLPLTYDGGGNHLAIDLAPGPKGTVGQIILYGPDDEDRHVAAASWGSFLGILADELEAGNFRFNYDWREREHVDWGDCTWCTRDPNVWHLHSAIKSWYETGRHRFAGT